MRLLKVPLFLFAFTSLASAQMIDLSAHRGDRSYFRENTLSAFKAAMSSDASSIEFDVHLTKDMVPVVYHDYTLNPKDFVGLEAPVLIKDLTLAQVQSLRFKSDKPLMQGDATIPTFEDFLKVAKARVLKGLPPKILHLEIKSEEGFLHESASPADLVARSLEAIDKNPIPDEIIARSFNWEVLEILKNERPSIKRILLVDEGQLAGIDIAETIRRYKPHEISPNHKDVTPELVQKWKQHGIGLSPWTVNDPVNMLRLVRMGVVGFATDLPQLMYKTLKRNNVSVGTNSNLCRGFVQGRAK